MKVREKKHSLEPKSLNLPGPHKYTCQKCSGEIAVYTHAQAKFVSCRACCAYYRLKSGELQFLKKLSPGDFKYDIPLGSRGVIDGVNYIAISACEKVEGKALIPWKEYTLFDPVQGYLYLSEYQGHWIVMTQLENAPYFDPSSHEILYENIRYRVYDKYRPNLNHSVGEFPFDVQNTSVEITELISPPTMLSREFNHNELRWYHGRHIESGEIQKIFNLATVPAKKDIGLIQPQPFSFHYQTILKISLVAAALFFFVQFIFQNTSLDATSLIYNGTVNSLNNNQPVNTPGFELKGGKKNLVIRMSADVDNQWLETGVMLVNDNTGQGFEFSDLIEYYHGYSDGESWSEGSRESEKIIESVPGGNYHLVLNPNQDVNSPSTNFTVELHRDVPRWSNLIKALFIIAIVPVIQFYRTRTFERQRWADSNYTPYKEEK